MSNKKLKKSQRNMYAYTFVFSFPFGRRICLKKCFIGSTYLSTLKINRSITINVQVTVICVIEHPCSRQVHCFIKFPFQGIMFIPLNCDKFLVFVSCLNMLTLSCCMKVYNSSFGCYLKNVSAVERLIRKYSRNRSNN